MFQDILGLVVGDFEMICFLELYDFILFLQINATKFLHFFLLDMMSFNICEKSSSSLQNTTDKRSRSLQNESE